MHKSFRHFAETLRDMRLHKPYTTVSSVPTTLTRLHISNSPSWDLPNAVNCALPVRHLRVLDFSDQAFHAQDLAIFSPSHFKSMLPQLQQLKLSDICLDGLHPFPQLEQADGLDLGLVIRWTERMPDNTASLQHLETVPGPCIGRLEVCSKQVVTKAFIIRSMQVRWTASTRTLIIIIIIIIIKTLSSS